MLGFRNMQEKLEKTISINCPCFYRVNTNGQILFSLQCTVVKHHYLLKDTRSTLGTEHKRANLQILFYAFMSKVFPGSHSLAPDSCVVYSIQHRSQEQGCVSLERLFLWVHTYTNKTNTIQLLVLIVHSESSHEKFIKRYPQ